nr:hypothetical protein [Saccharopolyspora karakumensis]
MNPPVPPSTGYPKKESPPRVDASWSPTSAISHEAAGSSRTSILIAATAWYQLN